MKIKQYQEPDMRSAMRRVREEMGPEAVIISTRKVGGEVEVLAALDYDNELATRLQKNLPGATNTREQIVVEPEPARAADSIAPGIGAMQNELARLRGLLEGELSELAWREQGRRVPGQGLLQKQLESLDLSRELCKQLLQAAPASDDPQRLWQQVLGALSSRIEICQQDILGSGGTIAMIGPTGVGKTTTVAKLAARFALRHGRNQVALITTDRFRVGAQEQLYTFGSILGVPVQAATTPGDLSRAVRNLSDRKLILIDTAGMSQRDMGLTDQFAALASTGADIKNYLVLSAIAQQRVVTETIEAFSHIGLAGAIVTKIDEAVSLGPIISALCQNQLALAFVGNGQRVPEDMLPARGESLVQEAVKLAQTYAEIPAASNTENAANG
jgi:flagellar biosynthesis protein FlhF